MYIALTPQEKTRLSKFYLQDQLFVCLCKPLNDVSSKYNDLTAVEIWHQAIKVLSRLKNSPRPDMEICQIRSELDDEFLVICKVDMLVERDLSSAHRTTMMVLLTVLFMLSSTTKDNKDNPYKDICSAVSNLIKNDSLGKELLAEIRKIEENEEKQGRVVPERDYYSEVIESQIQDKSWDKPASNQSSDQSIKDTILALAKKIEDNCILSQWKSNYMKLWEKILVDDSFLQAFNKTRPNTFCGGHNLILLLNIIGIFKENGIVCGGSGKLSKMIYGVEYRDYVDRRGNLELDSILEQKLQTIINKVKNGE